MLNSDMLRILWLTVISMYQSRTVQHMSLDSWASYSKCSSNTQIWLLQQSCSLKFRSYFVISFFVHSQWVIQWIKSSEAVLSLAYSLTCTFFYQLLRWFCMSSSIFIQSFSHSESSNMNLWIRLTLLWFLTSQSIFRSICWKKVLFIFSWYFV